MKTQNRIVLTVLGFVLAWLVLPVELRAFSLLMFGTLTVPNGGETLLLNAAIGKTAATAWTLRLYTVISPAINNGSVVANLTEAAGGGYAAKALTAATFTTTAGTPSHTDYPVQTFTFTGPLTTNPNVLGYYITNAAGTLVYLEPLAAAFTPVNNGDTLDVTLVLTLGSTSND